MKLRNLIFYPLFFCLCYYLLWIFDPIFSFVYDAVTQQASIETKEGIDQNLASLNTIPFDQLPDPIQSRFSTASTKTCYGTEKQEMYSGKMVYQIKWFQRYRYLVGDFRITDFLSGSELFINSNGFPHLAKTQYLVLDKALLYKILALRQGLRKEGLDWEQIGINSGFRTPYYNEAVGGKICSRHQFGDAVDLYIYDVNRDWESDAEDAKIVYNLLDQHIIGASGGLGKYKSNANVLHIDTRGFRARWHY